MLHLILFLNMIFYSKFFEKTTYQRALACCPKHNNRLKPVGTIFLILIFNLFFISKINAQIINNQILTIKQALEISKKNNPLIEIAILENKSTKMLVKTAYDIPKTDFSGQYGNVNDFRVDYSFNISQSFAMPHVYARNKAFLESQSNITNKNIDVQTQMLMRDTKLAYITLAYIYEKNVLYQKQDSIFSILEKIANARQKSGETSKLEYLNIQQKAQELKFFYAQNKQETNLRIIQLQKLLYVPNNFNNFNIENLKNIKLAKPDTNKKVNFALLDQKKEFIEAQKKYTNWQKSLLSPDLKVGYYTMQEGEERNKNLHVLQLGVAVPIFNQAQKKRVEESRILEKISEENYKNTETQATFDLNFIAKQHEKQKLALNYYENEQLPRLRELEKLAQSAYKNGETGYFEVLQVQFSVFNAEMQYIQELNAYLDNLVHWQYFTGSLEE